jgi:hypothetical protein
MGHSDDLDSFSSKPPVSSYKEQFVVVISIHPFGLRLTEDIHYSSFVSLLSVLAQYSQDVYSRRHL